MDEISVISLNALARRQLLEKQKECGVSQETGFAMPQRQPTLLWGENGHFRSTSNFCVLPKHRDVTGK